MVAYSYKERFCQRILDGSKIHTIRGNRRRHAREGEVIQHYYGMRTKHCRLIARSVCTAVSPIILDLQIGVVRIDDTSIIVSAKRLDEFARRDGFDCWADLKAFWRVEHPGAYCFDGQLIQCGALL